MPLFFKLIKDATNAVPAVKYAVGVLGIVAVIAVIISTNIDLRIAFWGTIVLFLLMTLLVLFAKLATTASGDFRTPVRVVLWFVVIMFIYTTTVLSSSVFFKWPVNLSHWLSNESVKFNPVLSFEADKAFIPAAEFPDLKYPLVVSLSSPEETKTSEVTHDGIFPKLDRTWINIKVAVKITDDYWCSTHDSVILGPDRTYIGVKPKDIFTVISGVVKSKDGTSPVENARIYVDNDTVLVTGSNGVFKAKLPYRMVKSHYKISVLAKGYESRTFGDYYPNSNTLEIRLNKK